MFRDEYGETFLENVWDGNANAYNGVMDINESNTNSVKRLAIVGGGAAGLMAAIAAGERARDLGVPLEIVVYERDDRVGRSILATGNGRCNFSNKELHVDAYHNSEFAAAALRSAEVEVASRATGRDLKIVRDNGDVVHAFFYKHGLMWRVEGGGREYPRTNKASTMVDILRASAAVVGVREACERQVKAIEAPRGAGKPFTLRMVDGVLERADAVVVACGGRALSKLDVCGLAAREQRPILGPLRVVDADLPAVRELDNIRVHCSVALVRGGRVVAEEDGELLFRKYGVSGICVFNLSRHAHSGDELRVDLLKCGNVEDAKNYLYARRKLLAESFSPLTCGDMLRGLILPRVADVVLKRVGLSSTAPFAKPDVPVLAEALSAFTLKVAGVGDADICQVRRGGLFVDAFDPRTMASREIGGLYAVGEALDVDGPCGGYNLHWAWASGLLAGVSAADDLLV